MFHDLRNQFSVGDYIKIDDVEGTVEATAMRVTYLRSAKGDQIIIPNGSITRVINYNKGNAVASVTLPISYEADTAKVLDLIDLAVSEYARQHPDLTEEKPQVLGVTAMKESNMEVNITCKVKPMKQWAVERGIRLAVKEMFDRSGVPYPYPRGGDGAAREAGELVSRGEDILSRRTARQKCRQKCRQRRRPNPRFGKRWTRKNWRTDGKPSVLFLRKIVYRFAVRQIACSSPDCSHTAISLAAAARVQNHLGGGVRSTSAPHGAVDAPCSGIVAFGAQLTAGAAGAAKAHIQRADPLRELGEAGSGRCGPAPDHPTGRTESSHRCGLKIPARSFAAAAPVPAGRCVR